MEKERKTTARELVYTTIKNRILSGEYKPGCVLNEVTLSNDLNVSRTPTREALRILEHDMLVTIYPKHGIVVTPLTLDVVHDVFQTRCLLEPFIIKKYGARIDRERMLASLKSQLEIRSNPSNPDSHYKADEDLHQIIIQANPNRYIAETLQTVYDQNQRFRILTGTKSKERLMQSCEEHLNILNSLLCADFEAAAQKMEEHLHASWQITIQTIASQG